MRPESAKFLRYALVALALGLSGCSFPRAVELSILGHESAPTPPQSRRVDTSIESVPAESFPSAQVYVESRLSPEDLAAFYEKALARRGWKPTGPTTVSSHGPGGGPWLQRGFVRGDCRILLDIYGRPDRPDREDRPDSTANVWITTDHWWEKPLVIPRFIAWQMFQSPIVAVLF